MNIHEGKGYILDNQTKEAQACSVNPAQTLTTIE